MSAFETANRAITRMTPEHGDAPAPPATIDREALVAWLDRLCPSIDSEPMDDTYDEGYAQGYAVAMGAVRNYVLGLAPSKDGEG